MKLLLYGDVSGMSCERNWRYDVHIRGWKRVGTGLDWLLTSSSQSCGESLNVDLFVVRNVLQVVIVVGGVP